MFASFVFFAVLCGFNIYVLLQEPADPLGIAFGIALLVFAAFALVRAYLEALK